MRYCNGAIIRGPKVGDCLMKNGGSSGTAPEDKNPRTCRNRNGDRHLNHNEKALSALYSRLGRKSRRKHERQF